MAYSKSQLQQIITASKSSTQAKIINNVTFNKNSLKKQTSNLIVTVSGDIDSVFSAQVTRSSDGRFYNFTTQTFLADTTSESRLKNQPPGAFSIVIPTATSGDTYTVIITAESHYNTKLSIGNGIRYAQTITQQGDSTISFIAAGDNINDTSIGTSTGSPISSYTTAGRPTVVMNKKQISVVAQHVDYGFFIQNTGRNLNAGTWKGDALYWQSGNYTASGAGTGSTSLVLTSVDGLVVGMQVAFVNSVYQTALRAITDINTDTKTVTLDGAETWSDTHVIVFRAYGPRLIKEAIGVGLELTNSTVELGQITASVRTELTSSGPSIDVSGTTGIGSGATVRMRGLEKSSSDSPCVVNEITGSLTAGSFNISNGEFIATSDRPIRVKTKIYIDGSSNIVYLNGTISIFKYPSANQNIYIDMNKILTLGQNS